MNELINKILKEASKYDNPFFQPKDLGKKQEEAKKQKREETEKIRKLKRNTLPKIKLGIENIKRNYKNKNWDSEEERLFLKIFSRYYWVINYDYYPKMLSVDTIQNKNICAFDLKYHKFRVSYSNVWSVFEKEFHYNDEQTKLFMNDMLKKHFKLNDFTPNADFLLS